MKILFLILLTIPSLLGAQSLDSSDVQLKEFIAWRLDNLKTKEYARPILLKGDLKRFDSLYLRSLFDKDEYMYYGHDSGNGIFSRYRAFYDTIHKLFTSAELDFIYEQVNQMTSRLSKSYVKEVNKNVKVKKKDNKTYYHLTAPIVVRDLFIVREILEANPDFWFTTTIKIFKRTSDGSFEELMTLTGSSFGY